MKKYIFLLLWLPGIIVAQDSKLNLLFAGDIMGHDSQIESAKTGDIYNYDTCFSFLQNYLQKADIAIANLEVSLAGEPYKGYPQFSSPDALALNAGKAGFDLFITANNHSLDRGKTGLERTLKILDNNYLIHTGTFENKVERARTYPLIIEKNGIRLAILNYTYGTNGLKVSKPNIVNYIDTAIIRSDLEKARAARPDFIIATIHWGLEYQRIQNKKQEETALFILKNGADAIIGSHPHVVQPVKSYTIDGEEKIVVYSLGNFISNQRKRFTDGGIIFTMNLKKKENTTISTFSYLPVWVYKPKKKSGGNHFVIIPSNLEKSHYQAIGMQDSDFVKMKIFDKDTRSHLGEEKLFTPDKLF